ncbi:hypothetical protein R6Q57_022984 [Mikania cordata]
MSFWDVYFFFGNEKIEQDSVSQSYHGENTKIPLAGVDIFWTKLDTHLLFLDGEEIGVEEQLQAVKQQIMTQPTEVKTNMMKKILATVFPGKVIKNRLLFRQTYVEVMVLKCNNKRNRTHNIASLIKPDIVLTHIPR